MMRFYFIVLATVFTSGCSSNILKNHVDEMRLQCGTDYNPDKKYLKVKELRENFSGADLKLISEQKLHVTAKGCVEKPIDDRAFISTIDNSRGLWIDSSSADIVELNELRKIDFPSTCRSTLYANELGFDVPLSAPLAIDSFGLFRLRLSLQNENGEVIDTWQKSELKSLNHFSFRQDLKLKNGDYLLSAVIEDSLRKVESKFECKLRLDTSDLVVLPADKVQEKRIYNGRDVLIVQPGYDLNFYVQNGFRDVKIEFCLNPLQLSELSKLPASDPGDCKSPVSYLNSSIKSLESGFWALKYHATRGPIDSGWQEAIFFVEKICFGTFSSAEKIASEGCSVVKGDISIEGLTETDMVSLNQVGRVLGDIRIVKSKGEELQILPNLTDVLGSISVTGSEKLKSIRGFSQLKYVLGDISISDNSELEELGDFSSLISLGEVLKIESNPKLSRILGFSSLESIGFRLDMSDIAIKDFSFAHNLKFLSELRLARMPLLVNLIGLSNIHKLDKIHITYCPEFEGLEGLSQLKEFRDGTFSNLPKMKNFFGLSNLIKIVEFEIDELLNLDQIFESESKVLLSEKFIFVGNTKIKNLESLKFTERLKSISIRTSNLESLAGMEPINHVETLQLESLSRLKSISDLRNLKSAGGIVLSELELESLYGLGSLQKVEGMYLDSLLNLRDLRGLNSLTEIGGDLNISGFNLKDFNGLSNLVSVTGNIEFDDLENLESLNGLENIDAVGGDVVISRAPKLENIVSLEGMSVKGNLLLGYTILNEEFQPEPLSSLRSLHSVSRMSEIGGYVRIISTSCSDLDLISKINELTSGIDSRLSDFERENFPKVELKNAEGCVF
ncbi:MAG: hypothetical protein EOP48_07410 [Sphingobacteriales bacterium]|nr:MAG: hypothetical protein EOP48_07410 [Sphingobacteriales bacterium]